MVINERSLIHVIVFLYSLDDCDGLNDVSWCRDKICKSWDQSGEWPCVADKSGHFEKNCKKLCCEQRLGIAP